MSESRTLGAISAALWILSLAFVVMALAGSWERQPALIFYGLALAIGSAAGGAKTWSLAK